MNNSQRIAKKKELETKLATFRKILSEAKSPEDIASAQKYVNKYEAELKRLELPDECFRV